MAIADPDNSASKRTVDLDGMFQILVTRNLAPLVAKKEIEDALQLGKLRTNFHIAAGARKTRPIRQATPEELKAEQAGKVLDFLYEASSGVTAEVDPQGWGSVFALAIRDDHLSVEPLCSLDFPWHAYSFSISNPAAIDHLWPDKTIHGADASGYQARRAQEILKRRWQPYGAPPPRTSYKKIRGVVDDACAADNKNKGLRTPSLDVVTRLVKANRKAAKAARR